MRQCERVNGGYADNTDKDDNTELDSLIEMGRCSKTDSTCERCVGP